MLNGKILKVLLTVFTALSILFSLSACQEAEPTSFEEAMDASTEKALLYYLEHGEARWSVMWEGLMSSFDSIKNRIECGEKYDYSAERAGRTDHLLYIELLTRKDLKDELEALAEKLLVTATEEKPNPVMLVAFKYLLNQDAIEQLIKGEESYKAVQQIYADMQKHTNSKGTYYGPHGESINYE